VAPLRIQQQARDAQLREAKSATGRNNRVVNGYLEKDGSHRCVRKPTTVSVKACDCSTLEMWAASRMVRLAPGILLRINSPAAIGVAMSWRPAITSVGLLMLGNSSRWSSVESASQQAR